MPAIKSGGRTARQRLALEQLEKRYEAFKKAKQDKHITSRGRDKYRSYADECARMAKEIECLKAKLNRVSK